MRQRTKAHPNTTENDQKPRLRRRRAALRAAALLVPLALILEPEPALAGLVQCNDLRLEDLSLGDCQLSAGADCQQLCGLPGAYRMACATDLHLACRETCNHAPSSTCTEPCTESCAQECERGSSVQCAQSCFGKCAVECDARCEGVPDPDQCLAICEATCDGECDVRCRPLVDERCYTHCVGDCGGSCAAQENLECQTACQEKQFAGCEHLLQAQCTASCGAEGALFCDGQYMLSGGELRGCARELVERGILDTGASVHLDWSAAGHAERGNLAELHPVNANCNVSRVSGGFSGCWLLALAALACRRLRR